LAPPVQLVGRDREIGIIRAFLDRAYSDGGAFLISGDAGVGKSVLIDAAAAYAASIGFMVLRATGAHDMRRFATKSPSCGRSRGRPHQTVRPRS
jgi:predicted ATP-dependent serine protease